MESSATTIPSDPIQTHTATLASPTREDALCFATKQQPHAGVEMMPYSGDRRLSPPPHPHATLSYLSPSATPFTAARALARATPDPIPNAPANPSPYPELPTAPSLYESWVEPPATYMDPASAAAPGYTGFPNSDGFLLSESAPNDIYSGNHFRTSMQPHPFTTCGSELMEEKYPGIYQRTSKAFSSDFGSSVVHQPSSSPNMLDCLDKKPCSTPQPVNPYVPYSYDIYLSQFPSCSTYPLNSDLSLPSVAATPEVCAATKAVPSTTDGHILENAFSSPYMNPCRLNLDYFDTMQNEQKDFVGYQTSYEHYGDWSSSNNGMRITGNYPLRSHRVGENYLIDKSSGTGRPVQSSSEVKSGLKSLQASYSKGFPPELAFAQPRDLFTEPLEVNNPVVDSPCWKGTPTVQKPSFGVVKNDEAPYSASGTSDLHDLHQSKNLPEFSTSSSVLFSKYHDTSNTENDNFLPYCKNYLSALSLPSECKKSDGHSDTEPSNVGTFNGMDKSNRPGYVSLEQGTRRDKHMTCMTGDDSENVVTPSQQGSVFPVNKTNESIVLGRNIGSHVGSMSEESVKKVSFTVGAAPAAHVRSLTKESPPRNTSCTHKAAATWENLCSEMPTNRGLEHLTHCNSVFQEDLLKTYSEKETCRSKTQAGVLKSMHSLSVMLLSTCNGSYELEESEYALAQSVIQNLNCLNSKLSKAALKVEDVNSNCCQRKSEKIMCNRKTCQPEKFAELDLGNIGADFRTSIVQDLTKLREDNVVGDTKDEQMLVYKNLWIEAEASMCKLKYELQLTRMKLSMKRQGQQTAPSSSSGEAKASNLTKHESSLCVGELDDLSKQQNSLKESNICSATLLPQGGASCDGQSPEVNRSIADKVDAAIFARLKVLKLRDENINFFYEDNSELQKERSNYNKTDSVDDSVIDNADDDRIYSLVEDIIKESPGASKSKGDEADDAVIAILKEFMSCNINTCSLDEDINQELPNSSKNKANGAVVARLKDLMSCSDNISLSGEDNACQRQTSSNNEFGQFEDDVMARLQVLKSRVDNTSSVVEGEQEVFHSDDWVGRFERERFGSAAPTEAHDGLIEKTELPDDVNCTTISNDVNAKTADQHLSTLLEESHLLSGPTETGGLHLNNEQSSHSPSEWEHVLKEDFFLPGNPLK